MEARTSIDCVRCGAPLVSAGGAGVGAVGAHCTYCGAVQPQAARPSATAVQAAVHDLLREDRNANGVPDALERAWLDNLQRGAGPAQAPPHAASQTRPTPSSSAAPVGIIVGVCALMMVLGSTSFFLMRSTYSPPPPVPHPRAPVTVAPAPAIVDAPAAALSQNVAPSASTKKAASSAPVAPATTAKPLTDEQWGQNAVAAQSAGLRGCMEQDLVRFPNAPKAYTVSIFIESDGAPRNSSTTFVPTPSEGFRQCARNVIFYGFSGRYGSGPPSHKPFTFTTSFAFPSAKPAAKAETGRGWDG